LAKKLNSLSRSISAFTFPRAARAARTKGLTRAISDLGFRRVGGAPGYLVWVGRSRR
jgi:hypothetical protein